MTNAVAVIGLTFDGTDIQQNPMGIFFELVRGFNEGPAVRGSDTTVPALAGRIARNRVADRRIIELRGLVAGIGATEALARSNFQTLANTVRTLFDPIAAPADLVAALPNATSGTIAARTLPTMIWDPLVEGLLVRVSVELESVDPEWVIT